MRAEAFEALLALYERPEPPVLYVNQWLELLGAEVFGVVERLGLLRPYAPLAFYPCGGAHGDGCPRRVLPNEGSTTHPFVAVCGNDHGCREVLLTADDRRVLALSVDGLVRQLRRALGITGTTATEPAGFPATLRIGELGSHAAFLARSPATPGFEGWLGARGEAVVLVPNGRHVGPALRERFGVGQRVQLLPIGEQVLLTADGLKVRASSPPAVERSAAWCTIVDQDGTRSATRQEYEALVAKRTELDLFLDLTVTAEAGGHPGSMRDAGGQVVDVVLTKHEAAAIAELVTMRKAMRGGDFRTVGATDRVKVVERARRKLDLPLSRYSWRSIHTLPADTPEAKRFHFNPPLGLRFTLCRAFD